MNTFLSPLQEEFRQKCRTFASEVIASRVRLAPLAKDDLQDVLKSAGQAGFLGSSLAVDYGGQGAPFLNMVLFAEAISGWEPRLGLAVAAHVAVAELIQQYGTVEQKLEYLPRFSAGELVGTLAFYEGSMDEDLKAVQTRVTSNDGKLSLSGKKKLVINGELAKLFVVLACKQESNTLGLFLVDKSNGADIDTDAESGCRALNSGYANELELNDIMISSDNELACAGDCLRQVFWAQDICKVMIAASALGGLEASMKLATEHANTATSSGTTLGQRQAIQWKLADHFVATCGARLQTYRAAWSKDNSPREFRRFAAMSKFYAAQAARNHIAEAMQVLGLTGLSKESPLMRFLCDAMAMEIFEGTTDLQKDILAQELDI